MPTDGQNLPPLTECRSSGRDVLDTLGSRNTDRTKTVKVVEGI